MSQKKKNFYRNTGTHAAPVWVVIPEVRDLDIPFSADSFEDSDRGSIFKMYDQGLIELGATYAMTFRVGNANCNHIRTEILTCGTTEYLALYGEITVTGSAGFRFYAGTFKGDLKQPLADGQTVDVEHKPKYFEEGGVQVVPTWFEVP